MKLLIVTKQSKLEYESVKFSLSQAEIIRKYKLEHANIDAIVTSHNYQLESRRKIRSLFPQGEMKSMCDLKEPITGYDLVMSFGGDNSFTYTSHFVTDCPIIGINSDPLRSTGALCQWSAKNLEEAASALIEEKYTVEEWTRLTGTINNEKIMFATSEYFFGERGRKEMTRHVLVYHGKEYDQKCSGIIIATGAGSTGWYHSANMHVFPQGNIFSKTEKKAAFIITEPYRYARREDDVFAGELFPGEEIVLHSLSDSEGYASSDSWEEYPFTRGKTARIGIDPLPLRVVVPLLSVQK